MPAALAFRRVAGEVAADAVSGGFGLLLMAAALNALSYALRRADWRA